jgi:diguanylate cyclase (GGDEF)-like protein
MCRCGNREIGRPEWSRSVLVLTAFLSRNLHDADLWLMIVPARNQPGDTTTPLEALLELGRCAGEESLAVVLRAVAETIRDVAGFNAVVVNIYRPAWDDYEVVMVVGNEESRLALEGTAAPSQTLMHLFSCERQRLPGVFFLTAETAFWDQIDNTYTPDIPRSDDPAAWQPDDGLLVFLRDSSGAPLGFLSMDEPLSRRRPTEDELRLLRAICSHAEQALASARRNEHAIENTRMLSQLLGISPALSACTGPQELLEAACDTVVPDLGFARIAAYGAGDGITLQLLATRGWQSCELLAETLSLDGIEDLLTPKREYAGCWLVSADELFWPAAPEDGERSLRNGRGVSAWHDCCLVVPCRGDNGTIRGLLVVEDPSDRLMPGDDRRRALRLLADLVSAALSGIEHREQLSHLATHDPLTGVRNRRGLTDLLAAHPDAALLVCDLDHFKQVNDRYGHDVGDRVLERFGELLRELSRAGDVPMRLGGEEFCVILPSTGRASAIRAAERLRIETSRRMQGLIPEGITVSIGVATNSNGILDAHMLLAAADRGLYAAKQAGRDRSVSLV